MGIVEEVLTEFEIDNHTRCRVEHNDDDSIHLHMDDFRMSLSESEFRTLVEAVSEAKHSLEKLKDKPE